MELEESGRRIIERGRRRRILHLYHLHVRAWTATFISCTSSSDSRPLLWCWFWKERTNTVVGPTSPLSSTKEKESDESLLLSLSLSLVVLSRFSQNPNFGNAGSENPSNICRRRLSLWIDPESEIGFLGLEVLWKPWEEGKNSSQDRSLLKTKGPDFFFFFLEEEEEHLVQQPLGSMIKGNKKEFSRNLVMGEAKKHCKLEWVSDWVSAYMLAWALTAAVMAASSLTYSAHCTGRPHGCLLHFHLSSQVREGESWSSFFLSPHAWRNLSTEMWSCLLVCCFFTNSNGGFVFLGPQRIYLSPNATTMHLCLNFADAFMWANAESMALIVELACLLACCFLHKINAKHTSRQSLKFNCWLPILGADAFCCSLSIFSADAFLHVGQMLNLSTQAWSLLACCCYFTNSQCKKKENHG